MRRGHRASEGDAENRGHDEQSATKHDEFGLAAEYFLRGFLQARLYTENSVMSDYCDRSYGFGEIKYGGDI